VALTSMTGFGQAVREGHVARVKVEIRTVNHRFAEFNVRMSRDLFALEEEVRSRLAKVVSRGRTDVFVAMDPIVSLNKDVSVNWALLDAFCAVELEAYQRHPNMQNLPAPSVQHWLTHPDVVQVVSAALDVDAVREDVLSAVMDACEDLLAMRTREGSRVAADMLEKVSDFVRVIEKMEQQSPQVAEQNKARLQHRLREFAGVMDEQRILTEVALLVDKMCIDEEMVRLKSHVSEFERSIRQGSPIGRRLDFIIQEMHREVNTIGSKATDLLISKSVVDAKAIVEQLREQAQNVE
jgi:uncharacterized protein (TIGR00255 family)